MASIGVMPKTTISKTQNKKNKAILACLSQYYPVELSDITSPCGDRTSEIFWNIACHMYGEDYILEQSRGVDNKKFYLAIIMRRLMDKLVNMIPKFGLLDMVQPKAERLRVIYLALVDYLRFYNSQAHVRDKILAERVKLTEQEEKLKVDISNKLEDIAQLKATSKQKKLLRNKLHETHAKLSEEKSALVKQSETIQADIIASKASVAEAQQCLGDIKAKIKSVDDETNELKEKLLPPLSVFQKKLTDLENAITYTEECLDENSSHLKSLSAKADNLDQEKSMIQECIKHVTVLQNWKDLPPRSESRQLCLEMEQICSEFGQLQMAGRRKDWMVMHASITQTLAKMLESNDKLESRVEVVCNRLKEKLAQLDLSSIDFSV